MIDFTAILSNMDIMDIINLISYIIAIGATGMLYYVLTTLRDGLTATKIYMDAKVDGWQGCHCEPPCEYGRFGEATVPIAQAIEKIIYNKIIPIVNAKLLKRG
jgi:hypothetical protein